MRSDAMLCYESQQAAQQNSLAFKQLPCWHSLKIAVASKLEGPLDLAMLICLGKLGLSPNKLRVN